MESWFLVVVHESLSITYLRTHILSTVNNLILDFVSRYLDIVKKEGLEISQPALDPNSTDIHHRITIRARTKRFHR